MAQFTLTRPIVVINNTPIYYVPNSVVYTEGKGEQNVRVQSAGGGLLSLVISENVESNFSKLKLGLYPTKENIALARSFKSNPGKNACQFSEDDFSRTISDATVVNDYDVELGSDTVITLEIMGAPAI